MAQTPTIIEKVVTPVKNANAAKEAQVNAALGNTAPSSVKVVAVPAAKPSAALTKAPVAKPAVVAVKPTAAPATPKAAAQKTGPAPAKPAQVAVMPAKPATAPEHVAAVKPGAKTAPPAKAVVVAAPVNKDPFSKHKTVPKSMAAVAKAREENKTGTVVAVNENKAAQAKKPEPKKVSAAARRDPFVSPVVRIGAVGSGCSSGKRCLAIDQIALRGVVKSENGMIAVVVNAMDKAYFLRENDPVFNGYVTKITPDSIIFKETFHDKLGKELTRDVTKTISRPAA